MTEKEYKNFVMAAYPDAEAIYTNSPWIKKTSNTPRSMWYIISDVRAIGGKTYRNNILATAYSEGFAWMKAYNCVLQDAMEIFKS